VPATSAVLIAFLSSFLLLPLTVLMKQTRQLVRIIKQSIYLDVYEQDALISLSIKSNAAECRVYLFLSECHYGECRYAERRGAKRTM
jgi:hypothetical protein